MVPKGKDGNIVDISPESVTAELVAGRYQVGEVIGRGGMASVYSARDVNLGRDVALKLFTRQSADLDELSRQEAEIKLLATLNHPSLVTLFDAGTDNRATGEPRLFLAMELVNGQDLRTRIRQSTLPLDELAVIGAGLADALAYVHSLGIIHRDIKPANILLVQVRPGEPLRPKLTDFGIARSLDATRITTTGTMVGTAAYLSPEQARGANLGPESDIYSLGLVLLECIKGELEYPGSAVESVVARLHRAPVIPDDVPAEWAHLLRAMTALDPLARPTAGTLESALRQALVSPAFSPGILAEEHTRVLPAPPAHPPQLPAPDADTRPYQPAPDGVTAPRSGRVLSIGHTVSRFRKTRLRTRVVLLLAAVALFGAAAAATVAGVPPEAPVVVPYPAVSGSLGEHLEQLQKSVEP